MNAGHQGMNLKIFTFFLGFIFVFGFSKFAAAATGCKIQITAPTSKCSWTSRTETVWPYTKYRTSCLARAADWQSYCKSTQSITATFYENGTITGVKEAPGVPVTRCEVTVPETNSRCVKGTKIETVWPYTSVKDRCLDRAAEWQYYCGSKKSFTAKFFVNGSVSDSRSTVPSPRCEIIVPECFDGKKGAMNDASGYWAADRDRCLARTADWQIFCKSKQSFTANFYSDTLLVAQKVGNMYQNLELPSIRDLPVSNYYGYSNSDSQLTWGASYELMSYLSNFKATRNLSTLAQFIVYAEFVRSQRDDKLGYNYGLKTWSSWDYSERVPYATLVGDGMITYPFADFSALILTKDPDLKKIFIPALGKTIGALALEYFQVASDTLEAHSAEQNPDGSYRALSDSSVYFLDSLKNPMSAAKELPFNQYLAMGRTIVKLYEASGLQKYKDAANKMATRFLANVSDRSGYPYWLYWLQYAGNYEDVSHGHIDVDFLRLCYEAGLTSVKWTDISNIAQRFSKKIYQGGGVVSYDILGVIPEETTDYRNSMSWMMLSGYNSDVKLIGLHAGSLLSSSSAAEGYGAYAKGLEKEFGGRASLNSSCNFASECASGICHPQGISSLGELEFEADSQSCQSFRSLGSSCTSHFDCLSGFCDFSEKQTIVVAPGQSHERQIPWGKCIAR